MLNACSQTQPFGGFIIDPDEQLVLTVRSLQFIHDKSANYKQKSKLASSEMLLNLFFYINIQCILCLCGWEKFFCTPMTLFNGHCAARFVIPWRAILRITKVWRISDMNITKHNTYQCLSEQKQSSLASGFLMQVVHLIYGHATGMLHYTNRKWTWALMFSRIPVLCRWLIRVTTGR